MGYWNRRPKPVVNREFSYEVWWTVIKPEGNPIAIEYGKQRVARMLERKQKRQKRKAAKRAREREANRYFCNECYPQCGACR